MAYNVLSGTVIAADKYLPGDLVVNIVSGNLSTSDASSVQNVPRVSNATNNAVLTNVGGDANTLTCESNLTFDGDTLNVVGEITASTGVSASFFMGDGSRLTGITGGGGGNANAQGPTYSLQFTTGSGGLSGSAGLLYSGSVLTLTGTFNVSGTLNMDGDMIPAAANLHDLGSSAKPWRDLYISGSSIHFGSDILSVGADNNLKFGSGSATKGFDVGFMNFKNNGIFMDPGRIFQLRAYQMRFFGGISYMRVVKVANYSIQTIDYLVGALTNAASASIVLTLPAANTCINGQTFVIKDEGGAANDSPVNITVTGDDTIDGQNTIVLESPYASIQLYCNGVNKYFIC
tara:strand:+ start:5909 stop:6946 length:1038 start_codon:yes stop_codon:yes gene_type:complete